MRELDAAIAAHRAKYRPLLARGFAEFVYRRGPGALVPALTGEVQRFSGRTWQYVGRELFGNDFVAAMKAVVTEKQA